MLSTSMGPYLDAELAYRLERLSDGRPRVSVRRRRRRLRSNPRSLRRQPCAPVGAQSLSASH